VNNYNVREILLKDVSVDRMARHLLESGREESLFAVYFDGFDAYCHLFWPDYRDFVAIRKGGSGSPEAIAQLDPQKLKIARVLDAHLARIDAFLGYLRDRMRPEDALVIVSDHGYGDNPGMKPIEREYGQMIRQPHWHTLSGILVATGGPIRKGARGFEASVVDVTPTVLALLGLPVGRDMDGRPIEGLLSKEFLEKNPVSWIPTYDPTPRKGTITPGAYDEAMKRRLRGLGYIDGEDEGSPSKDPGGVRN
jgi:Type I phosphodiesterase / nucleotide pyrophosphatase